MSFDLLQSLVGFELDEPESFVRRCEELRRMLAEANAVTNLTRIIEPDDFNVKHVMDSLLIAKAYPEIAEKPLRVADIGCGGGFPSLILALAFPHLRVTAIDSTGKKIAFVASAAQKLGLTNLRAVQGRAVELNCKAEFRGQFDVVTARAVAPSPKIYGETDRFVAPGGQWVFYKTPAQAAEEKPELDRIRNTQWRITETLQLPLDAGERLFVIGQKKVIFSVSRR